MKRFLPTYLIYLSVMYLALILVMNIGRIFLLISYSELLPRNTSFWIYRIFYTGWQFDSTIASYSIALPFLVLSVLFLGNKNRNKAIKFFRYYFNVILLVVISLVVSDLPYFAFYNSRLSKGIFSWVDSPVLMAEAILGTNAYYPFLILGVFLVFVLFYLNKRFTRTMLKIEEKSFSIGSRIALFLVTEFIVFLGIRGDWDFSNKPITSENVFISNNAFVNQASMNPIFNFFDSFRSMEIEVMSDEEAINKSREFFGIDDNNSCSPISRIIVDSSDGSSINVVLIFVESLSANRMGALKWEKKETPVLDSLSRNGLFFTNFYASGVHTHNGIYASLYGLPSILHNKPMSDSYVSQLTHSGLPEVLKSRDYETHYFCSGDLNFDNMGSFLNGHGFDDVNGEHQYKKEDVINSWGAADHSIYDYALASMNESHKNSKSFLTTILTVSSHDGYHPPIIEDFVATSLHDDDHRFEYTDWAIGRMLKEASSKEWFDNTIFVILGDHGQNFDPVYDLPLSYVHIPMIIYSPKLITPQQMPSLGMQIDVFPTIMGFLGGTYENKTLGFDLLKQKRSMVFFSSDDNIGCLDDEQYLLIRNSGQSGLYRYKEKSTEDESDQYPDKVENMREHVLSMYQTTQYLMKNDKLSCE